MTLRIELDHFGRVWKAQGPPVDLSVPVDPLSGLPKAWYKGPAEVHPVRSDGWVGSVAEGGAVNFRDVLFNPHAHGTHTETHEHIHDTFDPIDHHVRSGAIPFVLPSYLVDAPPCETKGDLVVLLQALEHHSKTIELLQPKAMVIRTGHGQDLKDWSQSNPPYLEAGFAERLAAWNIDHLLIDLPSVDREVDGGILRAHNAFFGPYTSPRKGATISELLRIPNGLLEGAGLLALQVAPFINDAAPSRPVWFPAQTHATTGQ